MVAQGMPGQPPAGTSAVSLLSTLSPLSTVDLDALVGCLAHLEVDVDDAERITQLGLLERIKGAAAAAQARVSVDFETSLRREQADAGLPADQQGRGVADQIALARHDSKVKGSRHLGLAKALVTEMPHLGDAQLARRARAIGFQLDAESVLRRVRGAIGDRRATIRPAPDTMALVTGFLPVAQGVAVHAALTAAAASAKALGDERSKGQIMADTFVQRLTGQAIADAVPLEVQLVMTDRTLLEGDDTPAQIPGFGPVPAAFARDGRGLLTHGFALGGSKVEIWRNTLGPDSASTQLVANAFNNDGPTLSPDGHWFAYRSAESGRSEIYVRPYPGPGGRWQVSLDGGSQPVWSGTGREIFYRNGDKMMAATVRTQGSFAVGERVQLFTGTFNQGFFGARGYDVSTDGETFLMLQPIVGAAQDLIVTLNWFDNLPRTH